ncbi:hypothetical protein I6F26_25705 [Ensifer sp. IC3342]|nr:hypothetical protein [Ensifer sp. BRP08]MCA1449958.1 hypothetical protein [Ensifer sp. IC3342]
MQRLVITGLSVPSKDCHRPAEDRSANGLDGAEDGGRRAGDLSERFHRERAGIGKTKRDHGSDQDDHQQKQPKRRRCHLNHGKPGNAPREEEEHRAMRQPAHSELR